MQQSLDALAKRHTLTVRQASGIFTYFGLPLNLYVVINYGAVVSGERRCVQEKMFVDVFDLESVWCHCFYLLFWSAVESVCCHFNYGAVASGETICVQVKMCLLMFLFGLYDVIAFIHLFWSAVESVCCHFNHGAVVNMCASEDVCVVCECFYFGVFVVIAGWSNFHDWDFSFSISCPCLFIFFDLITSCSSFSITLLSCVCVCVYVCVYVCVCVCVCVCFWPFF